MAGPETDRTGPAPSGRAGSTPSELVEGLFPHNAHVLGGFDPLPLELPADSPRLHETGASHGSYVVRLQDVDEEHADEFMSALGRVGGGVHPRERDGAVDLTVFATMPQVEALRNQLLAAAPALSRMAEEVVTVLAAYHRAGFTIPCGDRELSCGLRPLIMGVLNCTDDSFYAGSRIHGDAAVERGRRMVDEGADLLDVGAESTRPGSQPVPAAEQIERLVPVIEGLGDAGVPLSVDTSLAEVARAALDAGATMINDIHALARDPELGEVAAETGVPVVLMHMRGIPGRMYERADYDDVVDDVVRELRQALARAHRAGIDPEMTLVDPGIGFAKTPGQNYTLLRHLSALRSLGRPIVLGPSRKSFVGAVLDLPPEERLEGTAAAVGAGVLAGAHILRVHDVQAMKRAASVAAAIRSEGVGWIS